MSGEPKGPCVVCGKPAVEAHHPFGRANLAAVTTPTCKSDHLGLNAELRRAGVPLSHARMPTHAEIGYAMLVALTSVADAVFVRLGPDVHEQAEVTASLRSALTRYMLAAQPADQRTFGPEPLAQAGRAWRLQPSDGMTKAPESLDLFVGLFSLLSDVAQATLGPSGRWDDYVSAVSATALCAARALRRFEVLDEERQRKLGRIARRGLIEMAALVAALVELDPYEPSDEQAAAVATGISFLMEFERQMLGLMSTLGAAQSDEQAAAILDGFFATCGEL